MKAVVAQIVGRHAVLLTENGMFLKVKNKRYRSGQQITFCQKRRSFVRPLAMAASLMIFLLGGMFLTLKQLPYSYVSIDVNPSIEYTLNWFDRVLSLRAVNEDAKPIAQNLQERGALNQPIAIAVGMTIKTLNDMRYFKDDAENDVVIAVASFGLKNVNGLSGILKDSAGSTLTDHVLAVTSFQTDTAKVHEAQKYHTTAGKLVIVENLATGGDGFADETKEEWLKKPVREILGHNNGKAQTQADEKKPENTEHAADGMGTEGIPPKKTVSLQPKSTEKADAPKITNTPKSTDTPTKKHDQPNTEKVKQTIVTPTRIDQDKSQNTPAPKDKEQGPKTGTPGKGGNGGQEKENGAQEDSKEPAQPSDGGGPKKGKP